MMHSDLQLHEEATRTSSRRPMQQAAKLLRTFCSRCHRTAFPRPNLGSLFACTTTMAHAESRRARRATWECTCATTKGVVRKDHTLSAATDQVQPTSAKQFHLKVLPLWSKFALEAQFCLLKRRGKDSKFFPLTMHRTGFEQQLQFWLLT